MMDFTASVKVKVEAPAVQGARSRLQWRRCGRQRQQSAARASDTHSPINASIPPGTRNFPPLSLVLLAAVQPGGGAPAPISSPAVFLASGTAGNVAMAVLGAALGGFQGYRVADQLLTNGDLSVPAALAYTVPLGALCWWGVVSADKNEGFGQLKKLFEETLIPQLKPLPIWGLGLLALGAGVGEETLFRAFLQTAVVDGIGSAAPVLPEAATTAAGLVATSVLFGALHALTPTYFFFASAAGLLFGVEYLQCGLQTAAATHFVYDWGALIYILNVWGGGSGDVGGTGDKQAVAPLGDAAESAE